MSTEARPSEAIASPRRLNLVDLLLIVGGCGFGLALGLYYTRAGADPSVDFGLSRRLDLAEGWVGSMGLALSMTVLLMRLRSPRPPWPDLRSQPGFIAGLMVAMAIGLRLQWVIHVLLATTSSRERATLLAHGMLTGAGSANGILMGWVALRVSGAWKSEAGVIDRLGRASGWLWIATLVILPVAEWWES